MPAKGGAKYVSPLMSTDNVAVTTYSRVCRTFQYWRVFL
jgi:hypothetical protein